MNLDLESWLSAGDPGCAQRTNAQRLYRGQAHLSARRSTVNIQVFTSHWGMYIASNLVYWRRYHGSSAHFQTDAETAIFSYAVLWIRIGLSPDLKFWWQKVTKFYRWKILKNLCIKNYNFLSIGVHEGRPSYRRNFQPSKKNIQQLKAWNFYTFFQFLWVIFALLGPDPAAKNHCGMGDPCGS